MSSSIVTLTPSEFITAHYMGDLESCNLSHRAGPTTVAMREYFNVTEPCSGGHEVIISGALFNYMTIHSSHAALNELIRIADAQILNGVEFSKVIELLIKQQFEKVLYTLSRSDEITSYCGVFDQLFNHLTYLKLYPNQNLSKVKS